MAYYKKVVNPDHAEVIYRNHILTDLEHPIIATSDGLYASCMFLTELALSDKFPNPLVRAIANEVSTASTAFYHPVNLWIDHKQSRCSRAQPWFVQTELRWRPSAG